MLGVECHQFWVLIATKAFGIFLGLGRNNFWARINMNRWGFVLMRRCTGACQGEEVRGLYHVDITESSYIGERTREAAEVFGIHGQVFTVALLFALAEYHHFKWFFTGRRPEWFQKKYLTSCGIFRSIGMWVFTAEYWAQNMCTGW